MKIRSLVFVTSLIFAVALGFIFGKFNDELKSNPGSEAPLIGIASLTNDTYVLAIKQAGGIPIVLPNGDGNSDKTEEYLDLVDGLLMPGGADIDPANWGEEPHPTTKLLARDRYLFEKELVSKWIEKTDKPLLGICLGSQWINVVHEGSLIQDIPSELGVNHRDVTHPVKIEEGSRLHKIFGETTFDVNSLHHQAVRKVGKGLRIAAKSPDGVIEAIESIDPDRFLIGVQWHPEKLAEDDRLQARVFDAFIEAATKAKSSHR